MAVAGQIKTCVHSVCYIEMWLMVFSSRYFLQIWIILIGLRDMTIL